MIKEPDQEELLFTNLKASLHDSSPKNEIS